MLTWRRGQDDLRVQHLLSAPLLAVVRADHPLATARQPVPRIAVVAHPLVIHRRDAAPGPYDAMVEQLYEGRRPGRLHLIDVLTGGHEARVAALRGPADPLRSRSWPSSRTKHWTPTDLAEVAVEPAMTIIVDLLWLPDATTTRSARVASSA